MKLLVLATIVAALVIEEATSLGISCYQCITRHPSWAIDSGNCKKNVVTCALGAFCTKSQFGGSLVIRGCAPGGTEKEFVKDSKICKKTREYFASKHVSAALKTEFQGVLKVFEASCPPGNVLKTLLKKKEPKKGLTCKKKLCNGSGRIEAAAVSVFATTAAALLATKHWL